MLYPLSHTQGLFLALVVALMGKENVPKISLDSSIQQLRYAIHLDCDDMDGSVVLVDSYDWLELYYIGSWKSLQEFAYCSNGCPTYMC